MSEITEPVKDTSALMLVFQIIGLIAVTASLLLEYVFSAAIPNHIAYLILYIVLLVGGLGLSIVSDMYISKMKKDGVGNKALLNAATALSYIIVLELIISLIIDVVMK